MVQYNGCLLGVLVIILTLFRESGKNFQLISKEKFYNSPWFIFARF